MEQNNRPPICINCEHFYSATQGAHTFTRCAYWHTPAEPDNEMCIVSKPLKY